jgi:hypothetical protein
VLADSAIIRSSRTASQREHPASAISDRWLRLEPALALVRDWGTLVNGWRFGVGSVRPMIVLGGSCWPIGWSTGFIGAPFDAVWPGVSAWTDGLEVDYGVEALGEVPLVEQLRRLEPWSRRTRAGCWSPQRTAGPPTSTMTSEAATHFRGSDSSPASSPAMAS